MKKGINRWCFPEEFQLEKCLRLAGKAGFDGIELNLKEESDRRPDLALDSDEEELLAIRELADREGLSLPSISTSLFWNYSLGSPEEDIRERGKEVLRKMLGVAGTLGADTVLVVPGQVDEKSSYRGTYERAIESLHAVKEEAERRQVTIGVENVWNKFLMSPLEMKNFIGEIDSEFVGAYFDVGNVLDFSYPRYWIEVLGEEIAKVHVKDFKKAVGNRHGFTHLLQGDVEWPNVVKALRDVGYEGYLTAELSPYKYFPEKLAEDTANALEGIINL